MAIYMRPINSTNSREHARLLEIHNGTIYTRSSQNCGLLEEASQKEIEDAFTVVGEDDYVYTINDQFPGPTLTVYEGQQVVVEVTNYLYQESFTIHWHGIHQRKTNFMDGVPHVTQCAIGPDETFMYRFIADPVGTHWYHSHQAGQRIDGMYGALVVLPKPQKSNNIKNGFTDNDKEFMLIVQDWSLGGANLHFNNFYKGLEQKEGEGKWHTGACSRPASRVDGISMRPYPFESAIINGKGYRHDDPNKNVLPLERFLVKQGNNYRFRIMNTGMQYGFKLSIDEHMLTIVSTDGNEIKPVTAHAVYVNPAERYDVIIQADRPSQAYWIRAKTNHWSMLWKGPAPKSVHAILDYQQDGLTPDTKQHKCTAAKPCVYVNCPVKKFPASLHIVCIQIEDLRSARPSQLQREGREIQEIFLTFHFINSSDEAIRAAINGKQHKIPRLSLRSKEKVFLDDCSNFNCSQTACQCTHTISVKTNTLVQMVFVNHVWLLDGRFWVGATHPVHMHGHNFEVIKVGYPIYDPETELYKDMNPDIDCQNALCNNATWKTNPDSRWRVSSDNWNSNLKDAPLKDTVQVPPGGYAVVQFESDNPGLWRLHCHLENHNWEGMNLIMKEGEFNEMPSPPGHFPTCGNFDMSDEEFQASQQMNAKEDVDIVSNVHMQAQDVDDTSNRRYRSLFIAMLIVSNIVTGGIVYVCVSHGKCYRPKQGYVSQAPFPVASTDDNTVITAQTREFSGTVVQFNNSEETRPLLRH